MLKTSYLFNRVKCEAYLTGVKDLAQKPCDSVVSVRDQELFLGVIVD